MDNALEGREEDARRLSAKDMTGTWKNLFSNQKENHVEINANSLKMGKMSSKLCMSLFMFVRKYSSYPEQWSSSQTSAEIPSKEDHLRLGLLLQQQLSWLVHPYQWHNMHTEEKKNIYMNTDFINVKSNLGYKLSISVAIFVRDHRRNFILFTNTIHMKLICKYQKDFIIK